MVTKSFIFQKQPPEVFQKKTVFKKNLRYSQENTCIRVSFQGYNFIKKRPQKFFFLRMLQNV